MDSENDPSNSKTIVPVDSSTFSITKLVERNAAVNKDIVEPDYVVGYRVRRSRRWLGLFLRLLLIIMAGYFLFWLPDFSLDTLHTWKNPIIIFALICSLGKVLLDTLFYDHYRP